MSGHWSTRISPGRWWCLRVVHRGWVLLTDLEVAIAWRCRIPWGRTEAKWRGAGVPWTLCRGIEDHCCEILEALGDVSPTWEHRGRTATRKQWRNWSSRWRRALRLAHEPAWGPLVVRRQSRHVWIDVAVGARVAIVPALESG